MPFIISNKVVHGQASGGEAQEVRLLSGAQGSTIVKSLEIITGPESCVVEVIRKKMSSRNTRSVMDDIPRSESTFVVLLNFMAAYFSASAGSLRRSMKSMVVLSILKAMSEICEVR